MLSLTSPVESWHHRVPAAWKLAALAVFTMALLPVGNPWLLAGACLAVALAHGPQLTAGIAAIRPLWPFVAIIAVWHFATGLPMEGAAVALKLIAAVGFANLVTMTTRLSDMMAVLESTLAPAARLGLNVAAVTLGLAMAIRFAPALTARGQRLVEAWRARSPRRAGLAVVAPLLLSAMDDAERVAEALRARGGVPGA